MNSDRRLKTVTFVALAFLPVGCSHGPREIAVAPDPRVEIVEDHWPNGQLRLRRHVLRQADGTLVDHGPYTTWHDNGQQAYEATFVEGKIHGLETQWHQNGRKRTEQHYDQGRRHGPRYAWDEGGHLRKEEHYFNDKPDGTWTVWDESGRIKSQTSFDKGVPR
jgi:hypothetical protein